MCLGKHTVAYLSGIMLQLVKYLCCPLADLLNHVLKRLINYLLFSNDHGRIVYTCNCISLWRCWSVGLREMVVKLWTISDKATSINRLKLFSLEIQRINSKPTVH